jgi:hypothetical protein
LGTRREIFSKEITPQKILLFGAAGLAVVWLGWKIFKPGDQSGGTSNTNLDIDEKKLTYPKNDYKIWADTLEAFIWGTSIMGVFSEDDEGIGEILILMHNDNDIAQLIKDYGIRTTGILLKEGGNLVESIATYLDQDVKEVVNIEYEARGIKFRWI